MMQIKITLICRFRWAIRDMPPPYPIGTITYIHRVLVIEFEFFAGFLHLCTIATLRWEFSNFVLTKYEVFFHLSKI